MITSTTLSILLVNIYQPHSPPTAAFFEELSILLSNIAAESSASLLICGDLNCHGDDDRSVSGGLEDVLVGCDLQQLVHEPTREAHLLDILATSDGELSGSLMLKMSHCDCLIAV